MLNGKTILHLKRILKEEHIEYRMENGTIICWLDDKSLKIAKKVYTPKVRQKLDEEEKLLFKRL